MQKMKPKVASTQDVIKKILEQLDFTQRQLAEKVGVHHTTLSGWSVGRMRPNKKNAKSILDVIKENKSQFPTPVYQEVESCIQQKMDDLKKSRNPSPKGRTQDRRKVTSMINELMNMEFTQRELGDFLEVDGSTISKWAHGTHVPPKEQIQNIETLYKEAKDGQGTETAQADPSVENSDEPDSKGSVEPSGQDGQGGDTQSAGPKPSSGGNQGDDNINRRGYYREEGLARQLEVAAENLGVDAEDLKRELRPTMALLDKDIDADKI